MAHISYVDARKILDSRGEWTVEVEVFLDDGTRVFASAPQGKSKGAYEATSVSADEAVINLKQKIAPALVGVASENPARIDEILQELDGTKNKSRLGANATLGVSLAAVRAEALSKGLPLWKYIRNLLGVDIPPKSRLRIYANVINGGVHAGNNLDFQEYLIIPKTLNLDEAIEECSIIYQSLKSYLKEESKNIGVGDEGGFAPDFKNNEEPFLILEKVVRKEGVKVDFGLDAAASTISLNKKDLLSFYKEVSKKFDLAYLEDPFGEDDFNDFTALRREIGEKVAIIGDDLTASNVERMVIAKEQESVDGVIIKPNQVGTFTETLQAVRFAYGAGWEVIVSHRSGETNDDFIADFAYGINAHGIKLGAPARGERVAKYNRLLEISKE